MSDSIVDFPLMAPGASADSYPRLPIAARYVLALMFVAVATLLAFVVDNLITAPNLTLVYVLPVIGAAVAFGWGPSLAAAVAGVLAFDFFFTEPKLSFLIYSPSDLWAAALLLVVAAIVSTLAAQARSRAVEAQRAAEQAQALQALAHVIIQDRPQGEVLDAAATTLGDIFRAPAVIFMDRGGVLRPVASVGRPKIALAEEMAARGALETGLPARAGVYPYDDSKLDVWPVTGRGGAAMALGVNFSGRERPLAPERIVDVVAAYLAIALGSQAPARR
ncbi:DUF4118 domain-containing protein [Phenylobacterium sp.]|uniref:DUF4118 domain-containing protein n=1 Tax=Phenylobacterium sp. TaxID=1871053 RepID=UPI002F403BB9